MLTPCQLRMARAALHLSLRDLAARVHLSAMALSRYEHGDGTVLSVATAQRLVAWFEARAVFFGPGDGVCVGTNVFQSPCWVGQACAQLIEEHGIAEASRQLRAAYDRAVSLGAPPRPPTARSRR